MNPESPYSPPKTSSRPPSVAPHRRITAFGVATSIFLTLLIVGVTASRFRFLETLSEFEVSLPLVSAIVLHPAFAASLSVLLLTVVIKELAFRESRIRNAWNVLACLLGLLAMTAFLIGAFLPLMQLMKALS